MKPKLLYYEILKYQPGNQDLLSQHFDVLRLPNPQHDTPEILAQCHVILAPLGHYVGQAKIDAAPKLRVIGSNTTGHPHIDVAYARAKGIAVVTLKGEHAFLDTITPTAELTWGLIVALTRNMHAATRSILDGTWDRRPFGGKAMLSRLSLGVAGYGRLGRKVAHYGLAFGMQVAACDPFVDEYETGVERVPDLGTLVKRSDIVTVHIPHEPETENMFNADLFAAFKPGAWFINTSRGELVDGDALLEALVSNRLTGAAMDVIPHEFDPDFDIHDNPLWQYAVGHDNLLLTPHIGGSTLDAWGETERFTIVRILEALEK